MQDLAAHPPVDPAALVAALRGPSPHYKRDAVEAVAAHGEVTGPRVLDVLREALVEGFDVDALDEDDVGWLYATMMAVHLRPPGTHEVLLALARLDERTLDWLIGDYMTERFGTALFVTAEGESEGIRALLADRSACQWMRVAAATALTLMVGAGQLDRAEVAALLAGYLTREEDATGDYLCSGICNALTDVWPGDHLERIRWAYIQDLVHPGSIGLDEVEEAAADGPEAAMEGLRQSLHFHGTTALHELARWACFASSERGVPQRAMSRPRTSRAQSASAPSSPSAGRRKREARKKQAKKRKTVRAQRRKTRQRKR